MAQQMTIFDLLETPDWKEMTLKQIAAYISERKGLKFIPDTRYHGDYTYYIAYYTTQLFFTLGLGRFANTEELKGEPYISVGYEDKKNLCGGGSPSDSLEWAVDYFKSAVERFGGKNVPT